MSSSERETVVVRWDEGVPGESVAAYRIFRVNGRDFVTEEDQSIDGGASSDVDATRRWAAAYGYEVVKVVYSDADRALVLGAVREQMERAIEGTRQAIENEVRAGLRHVAAVAAVLAPSATHVVFAMDADYVNPVYTPSLLINADAPEDPAVDTHVAWSVEWHTHGANEIRGLLRLVAVGVGFDDPMIEVALGDAEGDDVLRRAYLSGRGQVVIPLAKLR